MPRLIFVVDNDFGELALVMFFLYRSPLAGSSLVLLSPRLADRVGPLGVRTERYSTGSDIRAAVDRFQADIVLLFSGYLLPLHGLVPAAELKALVVTWRTEGRQVITSDPFWGLMRDPDALFGAHFLQQDGWRPLRLAQFLIARRSPALAALRDAAAALNEVLHVIPVPYAHPPVPTVTYFNPRLLELPRDVPPFRQAEGRTPQRPYWLFVLSQEDFQKQSTTLDRPRVPFGPRVGGRERFGERLAGRLRETIAAGRDAALLAPRDCITAVEPHVPPGAPVTLLTFCPYDPFVSLLIGAEYVFYWNAISSSSVMRLVNELPVFYFDRGHVGGGLAPVFEKTVQSLYQGWQPPCLPDEPLTLEGLAAPAQDVRRAGALVRENLMRAPSPEVLVDSLRREAPATAATAAS